MVSCVLSLRPCLCRFWARFSQRVRPALAGADADDFVDRGDEDLAVADAAGAGGLLDGLDRALDLGCPRRTISSFTFGRKSTTYSAPR